MISKLEREVGFKIGKILENILMMALQNTMKIPFFIKFTSKLTAKKKFSMQ